MSRRTLKRIGVSSAASSDGTQSLYSKTRVAAAATAKGAGRSHLQSKLYWCRNRWKQAREPCEADAAMRGASCGGLRAWVTLRSKCINRRQLWVCDDRASRRQPVGWLLVTLGSTKLMQLYKRHICCKQLEQCHMLVRIFSSSSERLSLTRSENESGSVSLREKMQVKSFWIWPPRRPIHRSLSKSPWCVKVGLIWLCWNLLLFLCMLCPAEASGDVRHN